MKTLSAGPSPTSVPSSEKRLGWWWVAAWHVAGVLLLYSFRFVDFYLNFLSWRPEPFQLHTAAVLVLFIVCGTVMFILGSKRMHILISILLLISSLGILVLGCPVLYHEELSPGTFLGRDTLSPMWYKLSCTLGLSLPLAGVCTGIFRTHYRLVRRNAVDAARPPGATTP